MNLRRRLPEYDTPALARQWASALEDLTRLGELGVACAMGLGTRRMLFQVLRAMEGREVLDIGTYAGTSALAFALAVGPGGHVVSVDIRDANADNGYWRRAGRTRRPAELMAQAGVHDRVEFVTMGSHDYLRTTDRRFDLVSIDGCHEHDAVLGDVLLALPVLRPGGLIFLDDVQVPGGALPAGHDRIDGPRRALARLLKDGAPLRVVNIPRTLDGEWTATAFLLAA